MAEPATLRYRALDRAGRPAVGSVSPERLAGFVESKFRARWRELEATDAEGEVVGQIGRHEETGRRIWWAQAPLLR